ncbi:MAG: hypothetical protein RBS57_14470, partial [Desulforhabdus sp.]|nr:hypothetical protein [Desulforhabdus sp.]
GPIDDACETGQFRKADARGEVVLLSSARWPRAAYDRVGHQIQEDTHPMRSEGICEMCGHHVAILQKAHIVAENRKKGNNY